ncbi:MAG TPA: hypothetical protein VLT32_10675, partial [Candidatus Sulfomarinibacteraceae bacterium]|nr:hypothetical protein [Candidatus Sulfomarinibacteraceae bacterium]
MRKLLQIVASVFAVTALGLPASAVEPTILFETEIPGFELASGRRIVVDEGGVAYDVAGYQGNFNAILVTRIEPDGTPGWQTTLDGSSIDIATGVELDHSGNVVIVGFTDSADFPTTADALFPSQINFRDAFLVKLDTGTGHLVYGTYLGAYHTEAAGDVAIAPDGTIWLVGETDSPDFPVVNALQPALGNYQYLASDAFVTAISADGQQILYSTYFGATKDDRGLGIGIAPDGSIVIAGTTNSVDFPVVGGVQGTLAGQGAGVTPADAFVARISADGSQLLASTYLGGGGTEILWGFDLGPEGSPYLTGRTDSLDFPTIPDAVQPAFAGPPGNCEVPFSGDRNCYEGFVARLGPDLGSLVFGTYLGGDQDDELRDIDVDSGGGARVAGYSFSPNYPVTSGPGGFGIVAAQLDATGTRLDYAILLDADGSTNSGHGVAVGPNEATTYITGSRHVPYSVYVARLTGG